MKKIKFLIIPLILLSFIINPKAYYIDDITYDKKRNWTTKEANEQLIPKNYNGFDLYGSYIKYSNDYNRLLVWERPLGIFGVGDGEPWEIKQFTVKFKKNGFKLTKGFYNVSIKTNYINKDVSGLHPFYDSFNKINTIFDITRDYSPIYPNLKLINKNVTEDDVVHYCLEVLEDFNHDALNFNLYQNMYVSGYNITFFNIVKKSDSSCSYDIGTSPAEQSNQRLEQIDKSQKETTKEIQKIREENKGFFGNIINTITSIPKMILDGLVDILKKVFIPSEEFFKTFMKDIGDFFKNKLGFLYTPIDIVTKFFERINSLSSGNSTITIPEVRVPLFNQVLISSQNINLKSNIQQVFGSSYDFYLTFIDFVLWILFLKFASNKFKTFIKGGE